MDRTGLLADVSNIFAREQDLYHRREDAVASRQTATLELAIEVRDTEHLKTIIGKVHALPDILNIHRAGPGRASVTSSGANDIETGKRAIVARKGARVEVKAYPKGRCVKRAPLGTGAVSSERRFPTGERLQGGFRMATRHAAYDQLIAQGYCLLPDVLPDALRERLRAATDGLLTSRPRSRRRGFAPRAACFPRPAILSSPN